MKKRQKIEFSDLKHLLFGGIGGTTLSPLTENFRAQNPFSGSVFFLTAPLKVSIIIAKIFLKTATCSCQ